jgi:Contractile injection system tube protein/LysM domain
VTFARAHLLLEQGARIAFWFNPSTLRRARHAKYNSCEGAGQAAPTLEYRGTESESLSLELLLHANNKSSGAEVQEMIDALESLIEPTVEVPDTAQRRPQQLWFVWGEYTSPVSVCESVSTTIELFEANGTPLRAVVAITLTQAKPEPGERGQNPTTRATYRRRSHLVNAGDTLAGIAYAHYRDPTRWRAIASANEIDDPLRLPIGSRLTVPLEAR